MDKISILQLKRLLENVQMQGARNPKDERTAAVSISFKREEGGFPTATCVVITDAGGSWRKNKIAFTMRVG